VLDYPKSEVTQCVLILVGLVVVMVSVTFIKKNFNVLMTIPV